MNQKLLRRVRYLGAVIAVVGFLVVEGVGMVPLSASREDIPDCTQLCDSEANCADPCMLRDGEFIEEITCGDYNGGAASNQCNTCDFECNVWSDPAQECWIGGGLSDCETDGADYAECGDGLCQNGNAGEGCDTCAEDCGACPDIECGDYVCDPGESYVTCPVDCVDPGSGGFCGDGICSAEDSETPTNCEQDCTTPNERCEDEYDCGSGYTCIPGGQPLGGQCVLISWLPFAATCSDASPCGLGYTCL